TLAALARRIRQASERIAEGGATEPGDELWMGYDAIELLPVEPLIDYEGDESFWAESDSDGGRTEVSVGRPDMIDWGYDVPICGSGTVTATLLETGRPHELIDFVAALHTLPTGPIRVIFDVVYGHADNQAKGLMQDAWFTGPDMYGQHLDYLNPFVRAQLLEMQRRKVDFGADGLRVDGAQDFTWWDFENEELVRDDEYMKEMSAVVQEVAGVAYRPWMSFEDGRPWPRDDWELASTYRAVTEQQPHVFQWGPLTFAHNTPFLFTFWVSKWWRIREIAEFGSHWISGCANHDTLRRGSQVHSQERINTFLGDSLPEVIRRAYDHPAATLLFHGFLPGVPMDFLQGIARTPWSFVRTTDRRYALKVWGEEARFLDWRVTEEDWDDPEYFPRLKALGFRHRSDIYEFMSVLEGAVLAHGDAIEPVVDVVRTVPAPAELERDVDTLVMAARAWMSDVHDFCSVTDRRLEELHQPMVDFGRRAREFRRSHPWLLDDLTSDDVFAYRHPTRGSVLFYGLRTSPDGETQVLFVA
ncbi:MAG: glucosylglycerol hydrolase, partial [Halobacteriales archaeon]|nr:glucosylglycerol hydrolase [Halobacteriales archaeon]